MYTPANSDVSSATLCNALLLWSNNENMSVYTLYRNKVKLSRPPGTVGLQYVNLNCWATSPTFHEKLKTMNINEHFWKLQIILKNPKPTTNQPEVPVFQFMCTRRIKYRNRHPNSCVTYNLDYNSKIDFTLFGLGLN